MAKGRRKDRLKSFLDPSGGEIVIPFAEALVECAFSQLGMAFKTRLAESVFTTSDNHSSPHALGSVVLLVSALEAWLNECIVIMHVEDKSRREVANSNIPEKLEALRNEAVSDKMLLDSDTATRATDSRVDELLPCAARKSNWLSHS